MALAFCRGPWACHLHSQFALWHAAKLHAVGVQILSEDYSKAAFLCADRTVHLHARYGAHYATRIPRAGRDLAFAPEAADLLIVGSSPDIYRHNPIWVGL